jgi:hypothetical protein|tara:strand:+ start:1077 stop:1739 length:663 start_codon:yes stop_codon:yes gene_type:complete
MATETRRDWYVRKVDKAWSEALYNQKNSETFTKHHVREHNKKQTKIDQHQEAIGSLFNNELNYIINNKFAFVTNRKADPLIVIGDEFETTYLPLKLNRTSDPSSITQTMSDVFAEQDRFTKEIHFKRNYTTDSKWNNGWVLKTGNPFYVPQLNMKAGGYVDCGSYRHLDHIDCLLTAHEYVICAPAVRGIGKGSYDYGARILSLLMAHWIKEGKRYAHKR